MAQAEPNSTFSSSENAMRHPAASFISEKAPTQPSLMTGSEFDMHFPVPDEFLRVPSGSSVVEPDSVLAENGRLYHGYKEGKYIMPNDAAEQDRLDLQHMMCLLVLDGRLFLAPLTVAPKYVMDVATGTGIWAIQFAEQNPFSTVTGTDLSKIQPTTELPNVDFLKEDSEEEWLFPHIPSFDYIHLRFVLSCFNRPKQVLQHALANLTPGGWIEYLDFYPVAMSPDGSHLGTVMERFWDLFREGLGKRGRQWDIPARYKEWMVEAGMVDVKETTFNLPGNTWPEDRKLKRIGQYMYVDLFEMIRGAGWHLFRSLGLEPAEIEDMILRFKNDSKDEKYKLFYRMHIVYGRKPIEGEV